MTVIQSLDSLRLLHRRIEAALATVRGARDAYDYCPSVENWNALAAAEANLDDLLSDPRLHT